MSEEKKEQKIDLKDRMLSDDDLNQVAGGTGIHVHIWTHAIDSYSGVSGYLCFGCGEFRPE